MSKSFKLRRTRQCAKCPWKVSTDPYDIPHGYDRDKHVALAGTIAKPGELNIGASLRMMACHEHKVDQEVACVGWLHNQLGRGNNIGLRIAMLFCTNVGDLILDGKQHGAFEETLPMSVKI